MAINGYERNALLISNEPLDATTATNVDGFTVTSSVPTGTVARLAFKIDDVVYRLSNAALSAIGDLTTYNILNNGNIPAELTALSDIPALVGKKIYPIIALHADEDTTAAPTVSLALKCRNDTAVYEKIVDSPVYQLAADGEATPHIASISANTTCKGSASVSIQVRLLNGIWSNFMPLAAAAQCEADAVQFRITYNVVNIGTDSAKVNSITIRHNMGSTAVSGDVAELYSVVQNYEVPLQTCYVVVRHKLLRDAEIRAYVNFEQPADSRELIFIGTGTGALTQYILGVDGVRDSRIDQNTIKIYADGEQIDDLGYNVEVSEVTVNAPIGAAITASYDYNHGSGNWYEMSKLIDSQPYLDDENTYMTRFSYVLADSEAVDTSKSNVRLSLYRSSGTVTEEDIGVATGFIQQIILPHAAKQETIELNADWSYNVDNRVLTYVAAEGTPLVLSYDYLGDRQVIYSFAAGWAVV